jgi:uncharacterized protein (DUF885 family)
MRKYLELLIALILIGCTAKQKPDELVTSIADKYYERTLKTFPESAYFSDISLERHDQVSSNRLEDLKVWEDFEDSLYSALVKITESELKERKSKVAFWLLKEELESSKAMRVCKRNLWNVDHMQGWQIIWSQIAEFQPVGTVEFRDQALERWNKLPAIISTEIQNLRTGAAKGYTMPKEIVQLVIDQLQIILEYEIEKSPYFSPAKRDSDNTFQKQWTELLTKKVIPAVADYQNFLKDDYLALARDNVSILSIPQGSECYQSYIRRMTTINKTGEEIFELGQSIVTTNKETVEKLGNELYGTTKFAEIIKRAKADSADYFKTSEEIMEFNSTSLEEAKKESRNWFSILPSSEVTIKPYEPYESGIGSYEEATGDKPAFYRINLNNPKSQRKGQNEKLTFHEAYPGHHLQVGIQKDLADLHPISKLIFFGSYVEGWARYSEQLAEEMKLYKTKTALIDRRAWPSRGMVVDPALHIKGWTKSKIIDFMKESGMNESDVLNLYYRIIVWPAQLTSYDVGGEEIKSLRRLSKDRLGDAFDTKEFHTKILENGAIPLGALRSEIVGWLDAKPK